MTNCFHECERLKLSSIVFPALGTGNLKYPPQVTSQLMIQAAVNYMSTNHTSIKLVYYAVMDPIYSTFQSELAKIQSTCINGSTKESLKSKATSSSNDTFMIDDISVNIIQGDISDEKTDTIVNSTTSDMKLADTGACGALLKKAGPGLQKECDAYIARSKELKCGDVALIPKCGGLQCKAVLHVNCDPKSNILPNAVCACLNTAEDNEFSSISFPALGTGAQQCPPDTAAEKLLEGVKKFIDGRRSHSVRMIRIVIFVPEIYQAFLGVFNKALSVPASESWLATKVKGAMTYLWSGNDHQDSINKEEDDTFETVDNIGCDTIATTVCINIYGETEKNVQAAEAKVDAIIGNNFRPSNIENDLINELSSSAIEQLKQFSRENNVAITIERHPLNEIRLHGEVLNVVKVYSKVQSVLANLEKQNEQAERLLEAVEWQHKNSDGVFTSYDALLNYNIEKAYELDQKGVFVNPDQKDFKVDFATKMEHCNGKVTPVQRLDKSSQGKIPEQFQCAVYLFC